MNSESVLSQIQDYLGMMLEEMGLELFAAQFRQEGRGWVLRIFIDTVAERAAEGGSGERQRVSLDQCSAVSRELGHYLDVEDIIPHAYTLEVSSPGLERPLRSPDDCRRYLGKMCKIRLHNAIENQKTYIGKIAAVEGDTITIQFEQKELLIHWDMINKARLFFE